MTDEPSRDDDKLVAVFEAKALAERARNALLGAGIPSDAIQLIAAISGDGSASPGSADSLHGHFVVAVDPATHSERETVTEVLEGCGPVHLDMPRASSAETTVDHATLNHAMLSRADMIGKVIRGDTRTMRDMSGHPMEVQSRSEATMQAAASPRRDLPLAPRVETPPEIADSAAPPVAPANIIEGTTYSHGVPPDVALGMTAEEQIEAQTPAGRFRRVAWPDRSGRPTRVSSFPEEREPPRAKLDLPNDLPGS